MLHPLHRISRPSDKETSADAGTNRFGRRCYLKDAQGHAVPFRRVGLTKTASSLGGGNNPIFFLPDVSGPFGDPQWTPPLSGEAPRHAGETQLSLALEGIITPEMHFAAMRENQGREVVLESFRTCGNSRAMRLLEGLFSEPELTGEDVRREVAAGRAVIPANRRHASLEPTVIGKAFKTKVNANFGDAPGASDEGPLEKLRTAVAAGADTVMDLTVGAGIRESRRLVIETSPVPVGTVPVYEALERAGGDPAGITWSLFEEVMREQAEDGVDYMTIHAGVLRRHVEATRTRLTGIVSRGGGIMAAHMHAHGCENFLYEHFDEICRIARAFDVTLSLGDGLRSGCAMDANDKAQWGELETIAMLSHKARAAGVQVMIEGPGHVPMPGIAANQTLNDKLADCAPFYTLGPLVTDSGAGYDHVAAAIGGAMIGAAGASMLCFVTPKEHLGLPDAEDVREGMAVFRIAAHAADIAKGRAMSILHDRLMSAARFEFRWRDQYALSVDPERSARLRSETLGGTGADEAHFCSMCGPKFCPMKIARDWFE